MEAVQLTDREVLEILYDAFGGDDWTNNTIWLTDKELSEWHGVDADRDERVTRLTLLDNNLAGEIPPELARLEKLTTADLRHNGITGAIPPEFGRLKELRDALLSDTRVEGRFPAEMGSMTGLRNLSVAGTEMSGPLPKTFAALQLTSFHLDNTGLCVPVSLVEWMNSIANSSSWRECTGEVLIDPPSLALAAVGDTATLSATVFDADADTVHGAEVTWSSEDSTVAMVTSEGLVTGVADGTTEIVATYDSLTASAKVEVGVQSTNREDIELLYESLGGEKRTDYTNWLSDRKPSEWNGIGADQDGRVTRLSLIENNRAGGISPRGGTLGQALLPVSPVSGSLPRMVRPASTRPGLRSRGGQVRARVLAIGSPSRRTLPLPGSMLSKLEPTATEVMLTPA